MKKTLAFVLAVMMIAASTFTVLAADAVATYPVDGVSDDGYLEDDDGGVDLTDPVDMVPYGETVYFPLLNGNTSSTYDTAAVTSITNYYNAFDTARGGISENAINAAINGDTSYYTSSSINTELKNKVEAAKAISNIDTTTSNFELVNSASVSDNDVYNGGGVLNGLTRSAIVDLASTSSSAYEKTEIKVTKADLKSFVEEAKGIDFVEDFNNSGLCTKSGSFKGFTKSQVEGYLNTPESEYQEEVTVTTDESLKKQVEAAKNINNLSSTTANFTLKGSVAVSGNDEYTGTGVLKGLTRSDIKELQSKTASDWTDSSDNSTKKTEYNNAVSLISKSAFTNWKSQVNSFNSKYGTSYDIFTALSSFAGTIKSKTTTSGFKYVYEKAAAGNMKVSAKWEEGKSYVDSVSVVRKKISSDSYDIAGASSDSSKRYLYFLAIEIDSSSSTSSNDLFGEITLKQNGSSSYAEVDSFTFDVNLELGYDTAASRNTDGEIPTKATTFREGYGFEADSEFEFTFEADGDSFFIVNTNGQGRIVLALDTDYDDDIGDEYPDADLYFFNGNYATFNRVGELYLANEDDSLYVYSIDEDGDLTKVSADYDDSEEAYVIKTRTLGRYVLSSEKLSTTSKSSSSSSSSSGSSSGSSGTVSTVTPVTPVPSYPTYTTPVSSYTPPASSSTPPASSSEAEEPEEPEEEEELEEEEEEPEELEEEEEVIDVVVDDEENEGPEKKKGLSGLAWGLIIAGLAAVPVAIGVVYFIQNRPSKREFFEDDYDDEDDE